MESLKPFLADILSGVASDYADVRLEESEQARIVYRGRDLDDVRPGGLGVHIMTSCMDCLEFRQAEGGGTILTMVKRLSADGKDG